MLDNHFWRGRLKVRVHAGLDKSQPEVTLSETPPEDEVGRAPKRFTPESDQIISVREQVRHDGPPPHLRPVTSTGGGSGGRIRIPAHLARSLMEAFEAIPYEVLSEQRKGYGERLFQELSKKKSKLLGELAYYYERRPLKYGQNWPHPSFLDLLVNYGKAELKRRFREGHGLDDPLKGRDVWERGAELISTLPKGSKLYATKGVPWEGSLTRHYETACQEAVGRGIEIRRLFGTRGENGPLEKEVESEALDHLRKGLCTYARMALDDATFPIYIVGVPNSSIPKWSLLWITWDAKPPFEIRLALVSRDPKVLAALIEDFEVRWTSAKEVRVASNGT